MNEAAAYRIEKALLACFVRLSLCPYRTKGIPVQATPKDLLGAPLVQECDELVQLLLT